MKWNICLWIIDRAIGTANDARQQVMDYAKACYNGYDLWSNPPNVIRHFNNMNEIIGHILNWFLALVIATIASRKTDICMDSN